METQRNFKTKKILQSAFSRYFNLLFPLENQVLKLLGTIMILLSITLFVVAQSGQSNKQISQNTTDQNKKGSTQINPSTLALEIAIPLINYPGRNGNSFPITYFYTSKNWRMEYGGNRDLNPGINGWMIPAFNDHSIGGWSSSLQPPRIEIKTLEWQFDENGTPVPCANLGDEDCLPEPTPTPTPTPSPSPTPPPVYFPPPQTMMCHEEIYSNNEGGTIHGYCLCDYWGRVLACHNRPRPRTESNQSKWVIHRIFIHFPDGSAVELRKSDYAVQLDDENPFEPNGIYYSVDGSGLKLDYNSTLTVPDVLYLPDGSRYIWSYNETSQTSSVNFIDRVGNKLAFNVSQNTVEWKDTLGRTFSFPTSLAESTAGDKTLALTGLNNASLNYTMRWKNLNEAVSDPQLPPPSQFPEAYYPAPQTECSENGVERSPYLFNDGPVCGGYERFNPVVLREIVLPNGQSYKFQYNFYGEIVKIVYPSGSYERYEYAQFAPLSQGTRKYAQANRGVTKKWTSPDGTAANEISTPWEYRASYTNSELENYNPGTNKYKVITTAPDGMRTERYLHVEPLPMPFRLDNILAGRGYDERVYAAGQNGQLLRRTLTKWLGTNTTPYGGHYIRDPRVEKTVSIIVEGSSALAQTSVYEHDTRLNVVKAKEYGFVVLSLSEAQSNSIDNIPLGNILRTTETTYKNQTEYVNNRWMRSLPESVAVRQGDENGEIVSRSETIYDESGYAPLTDYTLPTFASGTWENPQTTYLGNPTTVKTWLNTLGAVTNSNAYLSVHAQTDKFGNIRNSWDAKENLSEIDYEQQYAFGYSTKAITPVPDPTGTKGTTEKSEVTTTFDFNTGLPLTVTNKNVLSDSNDDVTTTTEYNDSLLRPTKTFVTPSGYAGQTLIEYGDTVGNLYVKTKTQVDSTNYAESTTYFDGLGRAYKASVKDHVGEIFTETLFDSMGRAYKTSNPYRTGQEKKWTETIFDSAGRVWKVKAPLEQNQTVSAVSETTYGLLTTGNTIGVWVSQKDPAGKEMRSVTDGLGRLVRADEPTLNGLGTAESPNQSTVYTFDLLGNLRKVTQGEQNRYFAYDSLRRMIRAKNVEQDVNTNLPSYTDPITNNSGWSQAFEYDLNGNIKKQITARNITVENFYDSINRVTRRVYSDSTPEVNYFYDGKGLGLSQPPDNSKGKLTKVTNGVSENRYTSFDLLGRVLTSEQVTDGISYPFSYQYNPITGALVSETYPSGRVVTNSFDNFGRLSGVSSQANSNQTPRIYANGFGYNDKGVLNRMRLGNGLWESVKFNERYQTTEISLGTSASSANRLKLEYDYGTQFNNGDVIEHKITVPTIGAVQGFVATQTYSYDELNRVTSAVETENSQTNWQQKFRYDRYGNRTVITEQNRVGQEAFTTTSIIGPNPDIEIATNRIKPKASSTEQYLFDASGNMTRDAEGNTFTFDAENHQTKFFLSSNLNEPNATYFYDGDGRRVKKQVSNEITLFVYNAGGALVAEYTQNIQLPTTPQTIYMTSDILGSPRINSNQKGEVVARHDYLPFGDEIIGLGERTSSQGYGINDNVRKKFTGYEKDQETGLDFAQARYYGNGLGRFTSVDPSLESIKPTLPQSWNRYIYVINNPLNLIDPDGKNFFFVTKKDGSKAWEWHDGEETEKGQMWKDSETGQVYYSHWTHLIWVHKSQTNDRDKRGGRPEILRVTVYTGPKQKGDTTWQVVVSEISYSGTSLTNSIPVGEYFVNLGNVAEESEARANGPGGRRGVAGLYEFLGFQFIPDKETEPDVNPQYAWGTMRIRLQFPDWGVDGQPVYVNLSDKRGFYMHGQGKSDPEWRERHRYPPQETSNTTIGCIGCQKELVLKWMAGVIRDRQQNKPTGVYPIIPVTVHIQ